MMINCSICQRDYAASALGRQVHYRRFHPELRLSPEQLAASRGAGPEKTEAQRIADLHMQGRARGIATRDGSGNQYTKPSKGLGRPGRQRNS